MNKVVISSPGGDNARISHHFTLPPNGDALSANNMSKPTYLYGQNPSEENYDSLPDSHSFETKCSLHVLRRKEPLGASANKPEKGRGALEEATPTKDVANTPSMKRREVPMNRPTVEVVIANEIGKFFVGFDALTFRGTNFCGEILCFLSERKKREKVQFCV